MSLTKAQCRNCGAEFAKLKDGKIPTHDWPPPCRSVCRGSGNPPKEKADTPLWKDDSEQEVRDFLGDATRELQIYGFAIVKQLATYRDQSSGTIDCPLCGQALKFSVAKSNGHCAAKCSRAGCINMRE